MYDITILTEMLLPELKEAAEKLLIPKAKISKSKKPELIELILKKQDMQQEQEFLVKPQKRLHLLKKQKKILFLTEMP